MNQLRFHNITSFEMPPRKCSFWVKEYHGDGIDIPALVKDGDCNVQEQYTKLFCEPCLSGGGKKPLCEYKSRKVEQWQKVRADFACNLKAYRESSAERLQQQSAELARQTAPRIIQHKYNIYTNDELADEARFVHPLRAAYNNPEFTAETAHERVLKLSVLFTRQLFTALDKWLVVRVDHVDWGLTQLDNLWQSLKNPGRYFQDKEELHDVLKSMADFHGVAYHSYIVATTMYHDPHLVELWPDKDNDDSAQAPAPAPKPAWMQPEQRQQDQEEVEVEIEIEVEDKEAEPDTPVSSECAEEFSKMEIDPELEAVPDESPPQLVHIVTEPEPEPEPDVVLMDGSTTTTTNTVANLVDEWQHDVSDEMMKMSSAEIEMIDNIVAGPSKEEPTPEPEPEPEPPAEAAAAVKPVAFDLFDGFDDYEGPPSPMDESVPNEPVFELPVEPSVLEATEAPAPAPAPKPKEPYRYQQHINKNLATLAEITTEYFRKETILLQHPPQWLREYLTGAPAQRASIAPETLFKRSQEMNPRLVYDKFAIEYPPELDWQKALPPEPPKDAPDGANNKWRCEKLDLLSRRDNFAKKLWAAYSKTVRPPSYLKWSEYDEAVWFLMARNSGVDPLPFCTSEMYKMHYRKSPYFGSRWFVYETINRNSNTEHYKWRWPQKKKRLHMYDLPPPEHQRVHLTDDMIADEMCGSYPDDVVEVDEEANVLEWWNWSRKKHKLFLRAYQASEIVTPEGIFVMMERINQDLGGTKRRDDWYDYQLFINRDRDYREIFYHLVALERIWAERCGADPPPHTLDSGKLAADPDYVGLAIYEWTDNMCRYLAYCTDYFAMPKAPKVRLLARTKLYRNDYMTEAEKARVREFDERTYAIFIAYHHVAKLREAKSIPRDESDCPMGRPGRNKLGQLIDVEVICPWEIPREVVGALPFTTLPVGTRWMLSHRYCKLKDIDDPAIMRDTHANDVYYQWVVTCNSPHKGRAPKLVFPQINFNVFK